MGQEQPERGSDGNPLSGVALSLGNNLTLIENTPSMGMPNLSTRIGWDLGDMVVFGMLDFVRGRGFVENGDCAIYGDDGCTSREDSVDSLSVITIGAGVRKFFSKSEPQKITPYAVGGVYSLVVLYSSNNEDDEQDFKDFKENSNDFGVLVGGGAEYFLARQLSIGGELGLMHARAKGEEDGDKMTISATQLYSAVEVNFYF